MPKKNTYQADDVFERPIRKRKHHVFKKIGFLFLTVILLFFVYGMADIMSNWITGKEQTSWFWFFKNNIKQEEKILYAVSLGSYATKSEAEEIARNSNVAGAGGYVYAKDQVFYVLGNIYATIEDAEKVIDSMSNAPYQTSILSITIPKVKQYDQSATTEDIAIIKETLDFMEEIYQTLYQVNIMLDTKQMTYIQGSTEVQKLVSKSNVLREKLNIQIENHLCSTTIILKTRLLEIQDNLEDVVQKLLGNIGTIYVVKYATIAHVVLWENVVQEIIGQE